MESLLSNSPLYICICNTLMDFENFSKECILKCSLTRYVVPRLCSMKSRLCVKAFSHKLPRVENVRIRFLVETTLLLFFFFLLVLIESFHGPSIKNTRLTKNH